MIYNYVIIGYEATPSRQSSYANLPVQFAIASCLAMMGGKHPKSQIKICL
jgi:hypothetical protein